MTNNYPQSRGQFFLVVLCFNKLEVNGVTAVSNAQWQYVNCFVNSVQSDLAIKAASPSCHPRGSECIHLQANTVECIHAYVHYYGPYISLVQKCPFPQGGLDPDIHGSLTHMSKPPNGIKDSSDVFAQLTHVHNTHTQTRRPHYVQHLYQYDTSMQCMQAMWPTKKLASFCFKKALLKLHFTACLADTHQK